MYTVTVPPFDELEDRIMPWSQVEVICALSRTTVWRTQKTGDFPACVQVSRNRVGWWQSESLAWRRARTPRRLPEARSIPLRPEPAKPSAEAGTIRPAILRIDTTNRVGSAICAAAGFFISVPVVKLRAHDDGRASHRVSRPGPTQSGLACAA